MSRKIMILVMTLTIATAISAFPVYASATEPPLWSNANPYMRDELNEAQALGLIPDILTGTDFTKPVTRAEFAYITVAMCENYTGVETVIRSENPFSDTDDPYALKAYCFGLMDGTDGEGARFSPQEKLTREDMAYTFYRAIRLIAPLADYSIAVAPDIPDLGEVSQWAKTAVQYLYSRSVIYGGSNGVFMPIPRDFTEARQSSTYGIATREQCVVLATRIFKAMPEIQGTRFSVADKASEIISLAEDELTDGADISRDDLITLLQPYAKKTKWADNMHALSFLGDYQKTGDCAWRAGYDSAYMYNAFSAKGLSQYKYDEQQTLWGSAAGRTRYAFSTFDDDLKVLSTLEWNSESETGTRNAAPMQSFSLFSPLSLTNYMPSRLSWIYKTYSDEVFNGELCKVFSVTSQESLIEQDTPPGSGRPPEVFRDVTEYFYISTVSGLCVAQKRFSAVGDTFYQTIQITFNISPSLTDASTIAPPSDITFGS